MALRGRSRRSIKRGDDPFIMHFLPSSPTQPIGRKDLIALAVLSLLFAAMILATWQRWTQPLIDHGREMNLPARILAGDRLYVDVHFLYGPLAPQFNAFLYRVFGVHLSVLKISGAVSAVLILCCLYLLSRQVMGVWESAAAVGMAMMICALKSTANYIQPYAYASLYALWFALFSLLAVLWFLKRSAIDGRDERRLQWDSRRMMLALAGFAAGMALISKWEIALAALAAGSVALILVGMAEQRIPWREALCFLTPPFALVVGVYGAILRHTTLSTLLVDNRILFAYMPPQLVYFNGLVSGLNNWPRSLLFTVGGLGIFAVWIGVSLIAGAALGGPSRGRVFKLGIAFLLGGALWRQISIRIFQVSESVSPLAAGAIIAPLTIAVYGYGVWKSRSRTPYRHQALLVLSVFSMVSILRVILAVKTSSPYTPFFTPVLIILFLYHLFYTAPAMLVPDEGLRINVERSAIALAGLITIGLGVDSVLRLHRNNTFQVHSERGSFLTIPEIGGPLQHAIEYVEQHTTSDDYVLTLPQATTINFLADRRNPLREEIVHPGFLTGEQEEEAIRTIQSKQPPLIVITELDTPEFRDRRFGVDYNQKLSAWIHSQYRLAARFDPPPGVAPAKAERPFFILIFASQHLPPAETRPGKY